MRRRTYAPPECSRMMAPADIHNAIEAVLIYQHAPEVSAGRGVLRRYRPVSSDWQTTAATLAAPHTSTVCDLLHTSLCTDHWIRKL